MLRLPPALQALLASRIIRHSASLRTRTSLLLTPNLLRPSACCHRVRTPLRVRHFATASSDNDGIGDAGLASQSSIPCEASLAARPDMINVNAMLESHLMPARKQRQSAPSALWDSRTVKTALHNTCVKHKVALKSEEQFLRRAIPKEKCSADSPQQYYTCNLTVNIAGVCHETANGEGFVKVDASRAAWLLLVSKMQASGALSKLYMPLDTQKNESLLEDSRPHTLPEHLRKLPHLLDLEQVRSTCQLPSKEQYPHAPQMLWDPKLISTAIQGECGKVELSIEAEASYTKQQTPAELLENRPGGMTMHQCCTLNVHIESLCQETGYGEGFNKKEARWAAWLHVLSRLHVDGYLADIFRDPNAKTAAVGEATVADAKVSDGTEENLAEEVFVEDEVPHLTAIDDRTLEQEKDAKTDIYNYAAVFGLVPRFDTQVVEPRTARARLGRLPKKPAPVVRVHINLDELSIAVTATGVDFRTAEVAAALAFKREAEERHASDARLRAQSDLRVLNTDTAKQYLDFCKDKGIGLNLEMETEQMKNLGKSYQATLTADGERFGQAVLMRSKKAAQAAAYLTGALQIAKQHPGTVEEFGKALKKGHGKILKATDTISFELEPEAIQMMQDALVEAHEGGLPEAQEPLTAEVLGIDSDAPYRRQAPDAARLLKARDRLKEDQRALETDPAFQELRKKKASLPMSEHKGRLLEMINGNPYSIVVGATGSGKTTQVPQILLDDAVACRDGPYCNVICTQPRRIAATSVAQRVAEERNEPLRKTVGHHVRFDARPPYNPWGITYCTTGILLEKLKHDADGVLEAASHILIDEVHERDIYVDFLMIVLKKAIEARRAEGKQVPKVVLMSATLDTELFANYFKQPNADGTLLPAPCLSVPGRIFPVKEKYLGSIMYELFTQHAAESRLLIEADPNSRDFLQVETDLSSSMSGQAGLADAKGNSVIDWKREHTSYLNSDGTTSAKEEKEEALVPVGLLAATIAHICSTTSDDGAILAFLPGLEEIEKTHDTLVKGRIFGQDFADSSRFKICLLHSSVPKEQQAEVFESCSPGCRKIILSTNIAETSVTVADVKYVVDTGKLREIRYDQLRRITKLQCVWESKSNSKQRMGRAGRVQDGFYYALFSKERADSLRAIGLPELLRSDLQETALSITAQRFDEPVSSFLAQAIESPSERAVEAAVKSLTAIGAYTADEDLTALGRVLSKLPVHPSLGKMIIFGVIFKCLDPMIILGAAAEERPLFASPLGKLQEARKAQNTHCGSTQSDHLAQLAAFKELRQVNHDIGTSAAYNRSQESFLHFGAFRNIAQSARQIVQVLEDCGLIPADASSEGPIYGPADLSANANNSDLIKCLLLAGSHPNLAVKSTTKGAMFRTPTENKVIIHPSSLNKERRTGPEKLVHDGGSLFTFSTLSASGDGAVNFLRSSTKVTPLMAALFGGQLQVSGQEGKQIELLMDGWMPFVVKGAGEQKEYQMKLVLEFRKALERVLLRAYASLAEIGRDDEEGRVKGFVDDALREKFAARVVQVLSAGSGGNGEHGWGRGWGSA